MLNAVLTHTQATLPSVVWALSPKESFDVNLDSDGVLYKMLIMMVMLGCTFTGTNLMVEHHPECMQLSKLVDRCLKLAKQAVDVAGIKGKPPCRRAASSLGCAASGTPLLPPIPHLVTSRCLSQTKAARATEEQQGNGVGHALPAASLSILDGTCLDYQLADTTTLLSSCSTVAIGGAASTAADSRLEVAEASGRSTAALYAQTALPSAVSSNLANAHQTEMLLALPSSRRLSFASPDAEADADMSSSSTALLDDGTSADSEEQAEERRLESPGRFATAQFLLMQQRQQQLQDRRLAALRIAGKAGHMSAAQQLQQSEHQQTSSFLASLQPVLPHTFDSMFESAANHGAAGSEAVASSPVVLFSPGGPYSDKSKWYQSAGVGLVPLLIQHIYPHHTLPLSSISWRLQDDTKPCISTTKPAGGSGQQPELCMMC